MRPAIFLSRIADAPFGPSIRQPHESQHPDPGVLFGTKMAERLETRFAGSVLAGRSAQIASVVYDRSAQRLLQSKPVKPERTSLGEGICAAQFRSELFLGTCTGRIRPNPKAFDACRAAATGNRTRSGRQAWQHSGHPEVPLRHGRGRRWPGAAMTVRPYRL